MKSVSWLVDGKPLNGFRTIGSEGDWYLVASKWFDMTLVDHYRGRDVGPCSTTHEEMIWNW